MCTGGRGCSDLNVIQVADDPAEESWRNINAMDNLVEAILTTTGQLTVAALAGNAAAGGLMLALAADQVWYRDGPGRAAGASPGYPARLAAKGRQLAAAEKQRPLAAYRAAEPAIIKRNFSAPHEPYPELRRAFVFKKRR